MLLSLSAILRFQSCLMSTALLEIENDIHVTNRVVDLKCYLLYHAVLEVTSFIYLLWEYLLDRKFLVSVSGHM